MISFFRRALSSWLVLGLLGLIMIAFIVTGVGNRGMGGDGSAREAGDQIATVGGHKVGSDEVEQRVRSAFREAQAQQTTLTMPQFVAEGGFDQVVDQILSGTAMERFGRDHGLVASKRLVDGEIASIPAFKGPTGQFDEATMRQILAQQRISEAQLRADIASDSIRRQLLVPVAAGSRVPASLVLPYASLLLESREGLVGIVPSAAVAGGPPPSPAEIEARYRRDLAAYTIPERRALRYAVVGRERVAAEAAATEAEIAAAYKADSAKYAAVERRDVTQVVADTEAKARALAAAIRGGVPVAKAARDAGFSAAPLAGKTKAELADLASPAVADAAFATPQGGVAGPAKSDFGWTVVRVDRVVQVPGQSLAQVRGTLATAIAEGKAKDALADIATRIDDALADGSSFDEVAAKQKLAVVVTPPLTAAGLNPDQPGFVTPADVKPLLKPAFEMNADDDRIVRTLNAGARFALLAVARIAPAAPAPLAQVRDRVIADILSERAQARAKAVAEAIVAKAQAGMPLPQAFAASGLKLGVPLHAGGRRADLARTGKPVPPPLALLFSMAPGRTGLLAAPGRQGWFVVSLQKVVPGDARRAPGLVEATRGQFGRVFGNEYVQQFANAARGLMGVKADPAAIARLKGQLAGGQ